MLSTVHAMVLALLTKGTESPEKDAGISRSADLGSWIAVPIIPRTAEVMQAQLL